MLIDKQTSRRFSRWYFTLFNQTSTWSNCLTALTSNVACFNVSVFKKIVMNVVQVLASRIIDSMNRRWFSVKFIIERLNTKRNVLLSTIIFIKIHCHARKFKFIVLNVHSLIIRWVFVNDESSEKTLKIAEIFASWSSNSIENSGKSFSTDSVNLVSSLYLLVSNIEVLNELRSNLVKFASSDDIKTRSFYQRMLITDWKNKSFVWTYWIGARIILKRLKSIFDKILKFSSTVNHFSFLFS